MNNGLARGVDYGPGDRKKFSAQAIRIA